MQTRVLKQVGSRSALALLWVLSGGAVLAQTPPEGPSDGGGKAASGTSRFAEMKVSIDTEGGRLVVVVPKLLKTVGAEFIIDADVKNALVSSHLTNVKLHTALDVLLRTSDIPVQYVFTKGVYHFSKKVELPPETPPTPSTPPLPLESVLPPPPETVVDEIDIHKVQTFDLLRGLNALFGVPVAIDPSGDRSGFPGGEGPSPGRPAGGSGVRSGGGSAAAKPPDHSPDSPARPGGGILSLLRYPLWIGTPGR